MLPLVEVMYRRILQGDYASVDETPARGELPRVLAPGGRFQQCLLHLLGLVVERGRALTIGVTLLLVTAWRRPEETND